MVSKDQNHSNQEESEDNIIYFHLDSKYINTGIIKFIGIEKGIRSIVVAVHQYKTSTSINLNSFNEKTIKPLKTDLSRLLTVNHSKDEIQKIINSIVTCIHDNIDLISEWGTQDKTADNGNQEEHESDEEILLRLVTSKENTDLLFKNQYGEHYAAVRIYKTRIEDASDEGSMKDRNETNNENHLEIIPLNISKFKHFLTRLFKKETDGQAAG